MYIKLLTRLFLLFFLWGIHSIHSSGLENYPAGARSLALSNASVSFSDTWSTFNNQAGMAGLTGVSAGFFYKSEFGIDELSFSAGSLILPIIRSGAFGMSIYQFGKGNFKENKFGLSFSRHFSENWSAGIQLDYFTQKFPENERAKGFATFEVGFQFKPAENFTLGAHVFNPVNNGFEMADGRQKMPIVFKAGGHYRFDRTVLVAFEAEKDNMNKTVFKSGVEFFPVEKLALRIGVSGRQFKYTSGIGYLTDYIEADIGFSYHENLGITPSFSVQLHL